MRASWVRRRRLVSIAAVAAALVAAIVPAVANAHPLGNFTVNHYAALRVGAERIAIDVVVDIAEIPAFQERIRIDTDGNGLVSATETEAAREPECRAIVEGLILQVDGVGVDLELVAAGLSFPGGAGGVPTMRTVCQLEARPAGPLQAGRTVRFADLGDGERIGWREVVVLGNGLTLAATAGDPAPSATDVSSRLTAYPESLLQQPLDVRSASFTIVGEGPAAAPFAAPDARPIGGVSPRPGSPTATPARPSPAAGGGMTAPTASPPPAAVPGGIGAEIPALFQADLTPIVALGSILLAMALGAGHALTPGHGKTLMAASLVGARGTLRQALGLGLAVTVSHTLGILGLAVLVTGAEAALPADVVVRTVPVVAALAFVAIGAWMISTEVSRRRRHVTAHDHGDRRDHGHDHGPAAGHDHGHDAHGAPLHGHRHPHPHVHGPIDGRLTWRGLFALGLAGGIIPSTNALIILLGTIVAGRAAFGIVLVIAFGVGMAVVLSAVGALTVVARARLERLPTSSSLGRLAAQAPLVASFAVLGIGLWLTVQALGGGTAL